MEKRKKKNSSTTANNQYHIMIPMSHDSVSLPFLPLSPILLSFVLMNMYLLEYEDRKCIFDWLLSIWKTFLFLFSSSLFFIVCRFIICTSNDINNAILTWLIITFHECPFLELGIAHISLWRSASVYYCSRPPTLPSFLCYVNKQTPAVIIHNFIYYLNTIGFW